ncbi:MAG TPA: DNA polymerase II large subunit, partial [Candidatus Norongarragalinales archaeon]|nr:DNA polymerase II large subunit [Candidatus Norongarragalinales archaeon]
MQYQAYFDDMVRETKKAFEVATKARNLGFDPKNCVEIALASDVYERVEGLVGPVGVAERLRQIGAPSREQGCLQIVREIMDGSFSSPDEPLLKRLDQAIRTGLALFTEGVVSAPIEGISQVLIKRNPDNSQYLAVYFAGPIRGAGGTGQAFALLLADAARKMANLAEYRPTEDEVERYVEELTLYAIRTRAGQYVPTEEEIRHVVTSCPVCVHGEPTEDYEVNIHKNLQSVETNRVRSGVCLVISEGICLKAPKVIKIAKKMGLDWSFVEKLIKVSKKAEVQKIQPIEKYMDEIVAGRPIFSYPLRIGGFRLRYGRTRFMGIQSKGMHPATMILLEEYPAFGTQVKTERPGKGSVATPCQTIEGPTVLLDDGQVVTVTTSEMAYAVRKNVKKILFLGDLLISYGDFLKTNHVLVPAAFVDEWYQKMLSSKGILKSLDQIAALSFQESLELSKQAFVPLAPRFSLFWEALTLEELESLRSILLQDGRLVKKWFDIESLWIEGTRAKELLEKIGFEHRLENGRIVFDCQKGMALWQSLGLLNLHRPIPEGVKILTGVMDRINAWSDVPIRNKAGLFVGTSMGRPEKSRERRMQPPVHLLFPVGLSGGKTRDLMKAATDDSVEVDLENRLCLSCKSKTWMTDCPQCSGKSIPVNQCTRCGKLTEKEACCGPVAAYDRKRVDVGQLLEKACAKTHYRPSQLKAVLGLISVRKTPENLAKGVLRAKHEVSVFRDGTCRYDATEVPITHFIPKEIGMSVSRAISLGYTCDHRGNPLENENQIVELFPQDLILSDHAAKYLLSLSAFLDDELVYLYGLPPYYSAKTESDLIGMQVICLAPHTSAGITARVIGFCPAQTILAHPYLHCACRRNADGDELGFMLLLDGLLNFSKAFLPQSRGGRMDAPLVLTTVLNPSEVDDEVHAMECVYEYPLSLYQAAENYANPGEVAIETVAKRLGSGTELSGFGFTHHAELTGPYRTTYVKYSDMNEKVQDELKLMRKIAAVDVSDAAERIILNHFFPDLYGNLRSFSKQIFRCVNCPTKYRRVPLIGKCRKCGGKLLLTISKGGIEKYLNISKRMADE